jgi:omega-hydroxy-beta-dihydromenaquinone-9 sulfotransferase
MVELQWLPRAQEVGGGSGRSRSGVEKNDMRWRDAFFRRFGSNNFSGCTFSGWRRVLRDNNFSIDWPFWPRAVLATLSTVPNSFLTFVENRLYGQAIEGTKVESPLFILGAWRSGTTHLHNLLAKDDRFSFPSQYQVLYPNTFLLTERSSAWLMRRVLPVTRPQDAVKFGVGEPQEEDFAMCALTGQTSMLTMAFPRNVAFYERFMTMAELSQAELALWKRNYVRFLKKVTFKRGCPLVLKSPANTARIKLLLDLFPDAKFVHIHRNPYDVFRSTTHTWKTAGKWWQLQRTDYEDDKAINEQLLRQTKILYDSYFAQRSLIPAGRLHEIAFHDLERDPLQQLSNTYEALGLPDFRYAVEPLVAYLKSLDGYRKNVFAALPSDLQKRVYDELQRCFDEWGYAA